MHNDQGTKTCTKCEETKPLEAFGVLKSGRFGRNSRCKPCLAQAQREWKKNNPDYARLYFLNGRQRTYAQRKNTPSYLSPEATKRWKESHPEQVQKHKRDHRQKLRQQILNAYGGRCACCGESTPEFLAIDHVYNDGAQHRRVVGGGSTLYAWLKANNFPQDRFQLLCHNCNMAKGLYGQCPHAKAKEMNAA